MRVLKRARLFCKGFSIAGCCQWVRTAAEKTRGEEGQGTVEFAIVFAAFITIVIALGTLWHAFEGGLFVDHALASASHHIHDVSPGAVGDVYLY